MAQFDVIENPSVRARPVFPLIVILQSDLIESSERLIGAPLVRSSLLKDDSQRLRPRVNVGGEHFGVLVPELLHVHAADTRKALGSLAAHRDELLLALDYLFTGV